MIRTDETMDIEDAEGKGYYITNGKKVDITWRKEKWMRSYDSTGELVNPGKHILQFFLTIKRMLLLNKNG